MRPRFFVFRIDDVIFTLWFKNKLEKKPYKFIIFCHGLPSHPYQHDPTKVENFIDEGFVLVYPNYIGTWASYGKMSWENCTNTILKVIDFIKTGEGTELYGNSKVEWSVNEIILAGGSFGGSIALVTGAKSYDIKKIISVAAPTNWRNPSKLEEEKGEPIEKLYYSINRGWENLWRIPGKKEWNRLVNGVADINPIDYVDKLKNKDVFLIHGDRDRVVSPKRSEDLYKILKKGKGRHRIIILKKDAHLGNDIIGDKRIANKVIKWIKN